MAKFKLSSATFIPRGPNIWTAEGLLYATELPVRMTVIAYNSPESKDKPLLILISPFPPLPEVRQEIDKLGRPKYIVVPNLMHTLFAGAMREAYPNTVIVAPSLINKKGNVPFDVALTSADALPIGWPRDVVDVLPLPGCDVLSEIELFHKPSRSLIVTDMAFNFEKDSDTPLPPWPFTWYLRLAGGFRKCCVTTPFWFLLKEPTKLKKSLDLMLETWPFEQVIVAHGTVIPTGGREAFLNGTYDFVNKAAQHEQASPSLRSKLIYLALAVSVAAAAASAYRYRTRTAQ